MSKAKQINQSAHGLKPDCLPFGEVLGQSIAVIAPITTPAANLGLIFALSGNGTWLSFLIGVIGLTFVSLNINQFASRSASPGSLYSYIVKGLGPTFGVISGWSLVLGYLFTGMSVLCGFANFGGTIISHLGIHISPITLLAIGAGISWYFAYKDIELSARALLILEGISVALILFLGIIIWAHKGFAIDLNQLSLHSATPSGIAMGLVLVVFGFSGFESATTLGDEAKNPLKTIPLSVLGSTILAGIFFIFMAYVEVLGFSGTTANLAENEAPLSFLAQQAGIGFLGEIISLCTLISFFACVLGSINPAARIFFMMARHGLFHNSFGEAHASNKTPHIAVTMCSLLMFLIPTSLTLFHVKLFESMAYFGTICSFGFLMTYILVSIAAPFYLYKIKKLRPIHLIFSILAVGFMMIPVLGTTGIPGSTLFPVPEPPYDAFPYLFLLYLITTCGWFILQRLRSPEIITQMEQSIEEIHIRFSDADNI
ncbi:APC family permease [Ancylothrix sp. C2]|uniref:APC family permease n=1 Tax=Ancylothrix sp. D3o TaxID=2953691 RepID=UPI0021BA40C2|nr:APC family permease [Ancylothrix sp. D3o]MCT7951063.1 APC family permease [Ancylothrix sp. D3o]